MRSMSLILLSNCKWPMFIKHSRTSTKESENDNIKTPTADMTSAPAT